MKIQTYNQTCQSAGQGEVCDWTQWYCKQPFTSSALGKNIQEIPATSEAICYSNSEKLIQWHHLPPKTDH